MDAAHLHVALNHFPSIGAIIGLLLLLLARLVKNEGVELAGLAVLVLAAALTVPTYFSGGEAEEIVEDQPGISESLIEEHEEAGEFGLILGAVTGLTALAALWVRRKNGSVPSGLGTATLLLALLMSGVMFRVGLLGGVINHPELRDGFVASEEEDEGEGADADDAESVDGDDADNDEGDD